MDICRERFYSLLRYGYKHDGSWECNPDTHDCGKDWSECEKYLPDHDDVDLIINAIEFYNHVSCLFAEGVEFMTRDEIYESIKNKLEELNNVK